MTQRIYPLLQDLIPRLWFAIAAAIVASVLLLAGCRSKSDSDPVPASLPGTYTYEAKGSTFKKPWEFYVRLDLAPDRHYKLALDKTIDGQRDPRETSVGAYAVSGDHILLQDGGAPTGPSKDVHKLLIKGDSLIAEVGWTGELVLKGVGAPNVVFLKQQGT